MSSSEITSTLKVDSVETLTKKNATESPTDTKVEGAVTPNLETKVVDSRCGSISNSITKCEAVTGCNLVQLIAVIMVVASSLFLIFTIAYSAGFVSFETFIGPIGSSVFPTIGGALVFFSGLLVYCSFRTHKSTE